jgi:hypothetical protein
MTTNETREAALRDVRVIYVAPAYGRSGVGDYAVDFANEVRSHVGELIEYNIDTDGDETVRSVVRDCRRIRALARDASRQGPTIVHFEQSAGSLATFWGSFLPRSVHVTATIHDAPQPVWWPFKVRLLMRYRLLHHGVHYPFRFVTNALQRRACKGRIVITLTSIGARNVALRQPGADARATRIFVPPRPTLAPLTERPLAIGLFGHVYKGKGFDQIDAMREILDDDVEIVVAGRGTESLPPRAGVRVLGEVNDAEEDRFFESIRLLAVPYSKDNKYGKGWAASSAVARSFAYGTPIVCILDGALQEAAVEGGAVSVDGGAEAIAHRVNEIIRDGDVLTKLSDEVAQLQEQRTLAKCVEPFLDAWTELRACNPS